MRWMYVPAGRDVARPPPRASTVPQAVEAWSLNPLNKGSNQAVIHALALCMLCLKSGGEATAKVEDDDLQGACTKQAGTKPTH